MTLSDLFAILRDAAALFGGLTILASLVLLAKGLGA